jgi:hypothetical protein
VGVCVVPDRAPMDYPTLTRRADLIKDGLGDSASIVIPALFNQDVQAARTAGLTRQAAASADGSPARVAVT